MIKKKCLINYRNVDKYPRINPVADLVTNDEN